MKNSIVLIALIVAVLYCLPVFAEADIARDGGYTEKGLRKLEDRSSDELKQMQKYWEQNYREADKEMVSTTKEMREAQAELTRAKEGDFAWKDLTNQETFGDREARVKKAQAKYDAANKNWEKARDKHSEAIYREGTIGIILDKRAKNRQSK